MDADPDIPLEIPYCLAFEGHYPDAPDRPWRYAGDFSGEPWSPPRVICRCVRRSVEAGLYAAIGEPPAAVTQLDYRILQLRYWQFGGVPGWAALFVERCERCESFVWMRCR